MAWYNSAWGAVKGYGAEAGSWAKAIGLDVIGSRAGRGALSGAGMGAMYGGFSDDTSMFGSAFRGAMAGAMIGSTRGRTMYAAAGGAAVGGLLGSGDNLGLNAASGALLGLGAARVGRGLAGSYNYGKGIYGFMRSQGFGRLGALDAAGGAAWKDALRRGQGSISYIGNTASKAYNSFRAML